MSAQELKSYLRELKTLSDGLKKKLAPLDLPRFMREKLSLTTPRHILEWCDLVEKETYLLVEASRDHAKSWTFSYSYPLYRASSVENPEDAFSIALFSYAERQAKKNIKRIRQAIEGKSGLQWLKPKKWQTAHTWETETLDCSNGVSIEAYGFGSSFRGRHPKYIIVDDPCKDSGTGGMDVQEQADFFYGTIIPAARHGSQIVVVGNPVGKMDFLSVLESNPKFSVHKFPCWNESREPLWPEVYSIKDLEEKRDLMPAYIFAREYQLLRVSSDNAKFREEWIKHYSPEDLDGKALYRIMTIDPVPPNPGKPSRDALGAAVTGVDNRGRVYVLDSLNFRGTLDEGVDALIDMMVRHNPDFIGEEEFGFQSMHRLYLQERIAARGLAFGVVAIGKDSTKKKVNRIEALQPKIARGELLFREGGADAGLISRLLLWDPASKTNEDDDVDALAWQVPHWQTPGEYTPEKKTLPGSFDEAFAEIMDGERGGARGFFADMPNEDLSI